ncbi:MAG: hypothetical protein E7417_01970 [Ruminococcaceae bacterium]|nr:hypothetical protein [Oscillospiraceae bacterium]
MVKRSEKLAFIKVRQGDEDVYMRMKDFTELSVSANPKEYTRKYIDEEMERSAVVAYQPTISYKFDYDSQSAVHDVFLNVSEKELVGEDTVCTICIVDLSREAEEGYYAVTRDFYIIPDSEGNDPDTYTYSGNLKAGSKKVFGYATSDDEWQTMTFVA